MHRLIQDHLEEVLAEPLGDRAPSPAAAHLATCDECREEVAALHRQASLLRTLRAHDEVSPRPGFYARVMERIEAQRPVSIWQIFGDSAFGRRIAIASMSLAILFGVYLVSSERNADPPRTAIIFSDDDQSMTLSKAGMPDKDTVLVNLVTYREQ